MQKSLWKASKFRDLWRGEGESFLREFLREFCEMCVCVGYPRPKQEGRGREREREGRKDFEVMLAWMNVIFAWRTHG